MEELKLPPTRKVDQVKAAEDRAYERSYNRARRDAVKAKGAAAGMADALKDAAGVDAAVASARERVLEADQPKPSPVSPAEAAGQPPEPKLSGEFVQHSSGARVPREFYDLDTASQKRFLASLEQKQEEVAAESRFDNVALRLLDEIDKLRGQVKGLESSLLAAVGVIEQQKQQLDSFDSSLQLERSEALADQQIEVAQQVTNLSAIRAEAGAEAAQYQQEREAAAVEHRKQLEAQSKAIEALRGSVAGSTQLMGERSNAVVAKLSDAENRQVRLGVALTELEGKADALGTPITRAEVQALITDAVTAEWKAQQEGITDAVVDEVRDQFPTGLGGQRVDSSRTRQLRDDANRMGAIG